MDDFPAQHPGYCANQARSSAAAYPLSPPLIRTPMETGTADGESLPDTDVSPDHGYSFQHATLPTSTSMNSRKRRRESVGLPSLSAEAAAKSRRTTPSPAVTGNTTPASLGSFDLMQEQHILELLGGNPKEDMASVMAEQEAQERELQARKEQERKDAKFAQQLYDSWNQTQPNRPMEPYRTSSQSFLGSQGQIVRPGPTTPPASLSQPRMLARQQKSSTLSHSPSQTSSQITNLPNREKARPPPPSPRPNADNFIVLGSSDEDGGPGSDYGSSITDGDLNPNYDHTVGSAGSSFAPTVPRHEVPTTNFSGTVSGNFAGNNVNAALGNYYAGSAGLGGSNVYNAPLSNHPYSQGWGNMMGGYGQSFANAASGAWSSAQNLFSQGMSGYHSAGYNPYSQPHLQASTTPAVIDLDSYNPAQPAVFGDYYRTQAMRSMPEDEERRHRYLERIDYLTNDPTRTTAEIKELLENIRPDEELPPENREGTPNAMVYPLMEHQKLGLAWMKGMEEGSNKGGILADGMGLGKTIQALALMVSRRSTNPHCKTTLIVAPIALLKQWDREIKTKLKPGHQNQLTTFTLHGTARGASWEKLKQHDVVLTTFGTLAAEIKRKEAIELAKRANPNWKPTTKADRLPLIGEECKWYRIILDEAQCIKNRNTKAAIGACHLQAQTRFCMSGTPMQNGVGELYSLVRFLRIKPYSELNKFTLDFTRPLKSTWETEKVRGMRRLQAFLKSMLLRRNKKSTIDGKPILTLPERTTTSQHAVFSADEDQFYKALESQSQLQFNKYLRAGTVGRNYSNVLVLLLRLRQACCHPHLIKDFGISSGTSELVTADLEKMARELAQDVVDRIISQGKGNDHSGLECPVCMDAAPNATIAIPCGHATCSECFSRISDPAEAIATGDDGGRDIKCPSCRGKIVSSQITDYDTFKKVHLGLSWGEDDFPESGPAQSDSEDDSDIGSDGETTDDDETADEEGDDLGGFIVNDEDDETTDDEDEEGYCKGKTPFERCGKTSKQSKPKGKKGKGKGKAEDKGPCKTLAQLKKDSMRNAKARKKYVRRLRKDYEASAKITRTMDILRDIQNGTDGEKAIIFSQFTSLLDLLEVPIDSEGWNYKRYDGSMTAEARNQAVIEFSDKKECKIMLVSLRAGNSGLNLVAASQVIIMDPFWNPYVEEQAIDRAHRIGQQRPVQVHRILIENTVEDRILALQEKKRAMIESALDEDASRAVGRLGIQELGYLFVRNFCMEVWRDLLIIDRVSTIDTKPPIDLQYLSQLLRVCQLRSLPRRQFSARVSLQCIHTSPFLLCYTFIEFYVCAGACRAFPSSFSTSLYALYNTSSACADSVSVQVFFSAFSDACISIHWTLQVQRCKLTVDGIVQRFRKQNHNHGNEGVKCALSKLL